MPLFELLAEHDQKRFNLFHVKAIFFINCNTLPMCEYLSH